MIQQAEKRLYNLYYQYHLLAVNDKSKLRDKFAECTGDLTIEELSEKTGVKPQELISNYCECEKICFQQRKSVPELILTSAGFREIFVKQMKYNVAEIINVADTIVNSYLVNYVTEKKDSLKITNDSKMNIVGTLINAILWGDSPGAMQTGDTKQAWQIVKNKMIPNTNGDLITRNNAKGEPAKDSSRFNPYRFFKLVQKFDKLQGMSTIDGVPTVIRSLIDVIAYLKDDTIDRDRLYYSDNEFFSSSEADEYQQKRDGKIVKSLKSTKYNKELLKNVVDNSAYMGGNWIRLCCMYSGVVDVPSDKNSKKQAYHRLVDMILTEKKSTAWERLIELVDYSNKLSCATQVGSNSNTPIITTSTGYIEGANIEEIVNSLGEEAVFETMKPNGSTALKVLNDNSVEQLMEIIMAPEIIKDMERQLKAGNLDWVHLKKMYPEFLSGLKVDHQFSSQMEYYRFVRFNKEKEEKTYYNRPVDDATKYTIGFNEISEIRKVEAIVSFLKSPSQTGFRRLGDAPDFTLPPTMDFATIESEIKKCFSQYTGRSMSKLIEDLEDAMQNMQRLENEYTAYKLKPEAKNKKTSYSLMFCLKYDLFVQKYKECIWKLTQYKDYKGISGTQESRIAANMLNYIRNNFVDKIHYCLSISENIEYGMDVGDITTTTKVIDKYLLNPHNSTNYVAIQTMYLSYYDQYKRNDAYTVDDLGFYRTKSGNNYVLEQVNSDSEYGVKEFAVTGINGANLKIVLGEKGWEVKGMLPPVVPQCYFDSLMGQQ